jgi:hypothetical protein
MSGFPFCWQRIELLIIEDQMQKAVKRFLFIFQNKSPRKSRAQSLVEVAVAFPVLIMLLSGVIEFGFILNYYLSLLDATRESARYWSGDDPFLPGTKNPDEDFYKETALMVQKLLDPSLTYANPADYKGRRIILDPAVDDVIISVYGAKGGTITFWRGSAYHLFPTPGHSTGNYPSLFESPGYSAKKAIEDTRVSGAPNAGILMVEVHYNYHHVLSLPWLTMWLPNPLHLQAYSIMPMRSAEPP